MGESAEIASLRAEIEALKTQVMSMRSDMDVSGGAVSSSGTGGPATGGYGTPWAIPDGYRLPGGAGGDGLHPFQVRVDGSGSGKKYLIYLPSPAFMVQVNGNYYDLTSNAGSHSISAADGDPGWYVLPFATGDVWIHARALNSSHGQLGPTGQSTTWGGGSDVYIDNQAEPEAMTYDELQQYDVYNVRIASVGSDGVTQLVKSMLSLSPGWTAIQRFNANDIEIIGSLVQSDGAGVFKILSHTVSLYQDDVLVASDTCSVDLTPLLDGLVVTGDSDDSDESDGPPFEVEPKSGLVLNEPVIDGEPYKLDLAGRAALNNNGETFGIQKIVMHAGYTPKSNDQSVYVFGCNHFPANGIDVWPKGIISVEGDDKIHAEGPDSTGKVTLSFVGDEGGGQGGSDDEEDLFSGEKKVVIGAQYDLSSHKFALKFATVTVSNGLITDWVDDSQFDDSNPVFTATQHAPEVS